MTRSWKVVPIFAASILMVIVSVGQVFSGDQDSGTAIDGAADIVQLDDVIIPFSLCVGNDCINGEVFDFDTIRLKENNLRIGFVDTSASGSFPTRDWEVTINDSINGGLEYFAVKDMGAGTTPFLIAGATGYVGIGTTTPIQKLHVEGNAYVSGNMEIGSSRLLKNNIKVLESEAAFKTLGALQPVTFNRKTDPDDELVGFIAEDLPDLVATKSGKTINPVDIVAVLTKVIQEQEKTIGELSRRVEALEKASGIPNQ